MYVNDNSVTYFDSIGFEPMPKEIKKIIDNKNIIANFFRVPVYDLMCSYFCIGFIDFMCNRKSLIDFTNLF